MIRHSLPALLLLLAAGTVVSGQSAIDAKTLTQLRPLFPSAVTFSPKGGDPPHFKAYVADASGRQTLAGFAFWTTELVPLERGYDGPIKMLVGMNTKGVLTGVVVVDHHEPYGYFSIELPAFAAQFSGKDIRDPFSVGGDIDAISRASISISSAARAVKNSSRRVARELLAPPAP